MMAKESNRFADLVFAAVHGLVGLGKIFETILSIMQ
jgi:hypothetical protein